MNIGELINYGALGIICGVLLTFILKTIYKNIKELAEQHKEIIQMGCHNQDIQKEHKEAMKEIVTSLKDLNKRGVN